MNYWARRRFKKTYKNTLLDLLAEYPGGSRKLFADYPKAMNIFENEDYSLEAGPYDLAAQTAKLVVFNLIGLLSHEQRQSVLEDLRNIDWAAKINTVNAKSLGINGLFSPNGRLIVQMVGNIVVKIDNMRRRDLVKDDIVDDFFYFVSGAIDGKTFEEVCNDQIRDVLHDAVGLPTYKLDDNDRSRILPAIPGPERGLECNGTRLDVELIKQDDLSIIIRTEDARAIELQGWLSSDEIGRLPFNVPPYMYVECQTNEYGFQRCLIVGPDSEVFGSMRAFFWSLCATIVSVEVAMLGSARLTANARISAGLEAKNVWDAALKEANDVDTLRNTPVYMQNIHFEALNNYIEGAESDLEKHGRRKGFAMVLASLSGDDLMERYAFEELGWFIWQGRNFPIEFESYQTIDPFESK